MAEAAPIGLSWAPKLPSLPTTSGGKKDTGASSSRAQGSLWKPESELVDGLFVPPRDPRKANKLARKNVKDTSGKGWFDMPAPTITPELKKDLEILQLRHVMDPKRHFKRAGKSKALPKYFQVGTVIEPASEFFSSRLTKRERKTTLVDELLSDQHLKNYRMRKVREIQESRTPGGNQKWRNKGKKTLKRAKDRRK
ncbi:rRNA-processing protein fcf2-like [Oryza glaberrima]|uniref:Fcf2 pre-rRNA processing C-terminal domain-containing protein n=2 Tax=Oryza TaxID=4527 RepID=A0A0D3FA24_9ORYZ|nr:rRNA-processing protein fcf2-like [Oryza glaberrima]